MHNHIARGATLSAARHTTRWLYPLTLAVALASAAQVAEADTIGLHLYSPHFNKDKSLPEAVQFNDVTPGLYWRGDSGMTLGVVRNSLKRASVYAAYTVETESGRFALTLGAMTGYQNRRERGAQFCPRDSKPLFPGLCEAEVGKTNAHLRPLIAPSFVWLEAKPYIGAVPRITLLGKAISFSLEVSL